MIPRQQASGTLTPQSKGFDVADAHVLATAKVNGQDRPLIWVKQNGKGRIFASILGHYTWTLDDPIFRKMLLRGIAWAAGAEAGNLKIE